MCWSAEASFAIAAVGAAATVVSIRRGDTPCLWVPLGYFTLMEILQGYSYSVIDQCGLPANQMAALLAYIHIAFHPMMGCILAMAFVPDQVRRRLFAPLMVISSLTAAYMLAQIYPFDWAGPCRDGRVLCGDMMCVTRESWHLGWHLPLNDIGERVPAMILGPDIHLQLPVYSLVMFVVPALVGSWRVVLYQISVGPTLAWALTDSPNEMPAIWCMFSAGIVALVIFTPLRQLMAVQYHWFWPKSWTCPKYQEASP